MVTSRLCHDSLYNISSTNRYGYQKSFCEGEEGSELETNNVTPIWEPIVQTMWDP
jgi:hypothetical protein